MRLPHFDNGVAVFPGDWTEWFAAEGCKVAPYTMPDRNEVAVVRWDLDLARKLTAMGYGVQSPINDDYNWPGMFQPMAHQAVTAGQLALYDRMFLLSDPGTGKTASVVWAWDYLRRKGKAGRLLITAPLSCLHSVWQDELFRIVPHRSSAVVAGSREQRLKAIASGAEVLVINHDGLKIEPVLKALIADTTITHIAVDEATAFKNARRNLFKSLARVADGRALWAITGTPTAQSPADCWSMCSLINPANVPGSFGLFRDTVCVPKGKFGWRPRPEAAEVVHRAMQPAVRYARDQCMDLPPQIIMSRDAELTDQQRKMSAAMIKEWLIEDQQAGAPSISGATAATRATKLLQIYQGAVRADDGSVLDVDCGPRLKALDDIIAETGDKVLVFCNYTAVLQKVASHLEKTYTVRIIDGSVPESERRQIVADFQTTDKPQIIVAHPRTTSHGLTLTAATAIVWYGPTPSVETFMQGNRRIDRKGQTKANFVHLLSAASAERVGFNNVRFGVNEQESVLRMYEAAIGE